MSGQCIGVDFGFMVQQSQDSKHFHCLQGVNGETCYCLIVDHYSAVFMANASALRPLQSTSY
jgi:hypothetical protein